MLWEKIQKILEYNTYLPDLLTDLCHLFFNILIKMKLDILYIGTNEQKFLTADIPFIIDAAENYFFIPISDNIWLYFYWYNIENDFWFFRSRYIDNVSEENIYKLNFHIFYQAEQFVFFNELVDKNYIKELNYFSKKFFQKQNKNP